MFLFAVTVHCAKASEVAYKIYQRTNSEITNIPLEYARLNRETIAGNLRNPGSKHGSVCSFLQPNTTHSKKEMISSKEDNAWDSNCVET
jgi:hypothetical protein